MRVDRVSDPSALPAESVVVATYLSGEDLPDSLRQLANAVGIHDLEDARSRGELTGSLYTVTLFRGRPSLLLVGLSRRRDFSDVRWRRAVEAGVRYVSRRGFSHVSVAIPPDLQSRRFSEAAVGAVVAGCYQEQLCKTEDLEVSSVQGMSLLTQDDSADLNGALMLAESTSVARDLVNLPPSDLTPTALGERARSMAAEAGLRVEVLGRDGIQALGMGAMLGVAKGSGEPPALIRLECGDVASDTRLTFVGKGLTFDSGGLSLKTAEGMEWMKGDMGGAAAVLGAMRALGLLKPEGILVRGLIGAVENLPGPHAMKPGDVLRTKNGKTIEVLNTDAEGRLVLSDVLSHALELGATHLVDLATLTGAAVVALGTEAAALVGRPQSWVDEVGDAAAAAMERAWQLPLYPEFRRRIRSDIADMKNTGGRAGGGGVLTAAALLSEFVDGVPWAHLDIAGTAFVESSNGYSAIGGTGYGVATLVELARRLAANAAERINPL